MPAYTSDQTPPPTVVANPYIKGPRPVAVNSLSGSGPTVSATTSSTRSRQTTSGSSGVAVQIEGSTVLASASTINFRGTGLTVTQGNGVVTVNIPTGTSSNVTTIAGANVTGSVASANRANVANVANSVAVANVTGIGNIATLNLSGSGSTVLYGNGVFAAIASGGGGGSYNQSLNTTDNVLFNSLTVATGVSCISAGIPTVRGGTELYLTANNRISVQTGVFGLSTLTPERKAAIGLADGDMYLTSADGELKAVSQGRDASVMLRVTAPTTAIGAFGDVPGLFAYSTSYFYVCTDFYDGTTSIWKRTALTTW
jgi:hypothetical protein